MNKQDVRQAWVVPKLEQIEMINTQTLASCPSVGTTGSKSMMGVETAPGCGVGS